MLEARCREDTKPIARTQKYQQKENSSKINTKTAAKNAKAVAKNVNTVAKNTRTAEKIIKGSTKTEKVRKLAAAKRRHAQSPCTFSSIHIKNAHKMSFFSVRW